MIAAIAFAAVVGVALVPTGPARASTVLASSLPGMLQASADVSFPAYDRSLFEHWIDADGDGCDTRREVLIEESLSAVTVGTGCALTGGSWYSAMDGATYTDPSLLDIDHMVALSEAWRSGAWSWTAAMRKAFANDVDVPYVLSAVTAAVNGQKSAWDPAQWLPPRAEFICEYVTSWALIKYRWSLTVDPGEMATYLAVLSGACGSLSINLPLQLNVIAPPDSNNPGQTIITPFDSGVTRLSGASRYDTALAVSQRFAPGVPVLYVATGVNFPDALSAAAAAAARGGPLVLTPPGALTPEVEAEVRRLAPKAIVVVGGTGAVSDAVLAALSAVANTTRLGGSNRYSTGLAIVDDAFDSSSTVFLATGRGFADALAATGAAGSNDAPVILVDGSLPTLDLDTLRTLEDLEVGSVAIAGGANAVSLGIESQLLNLGFEVDRYGGANRYETAATINGAFFTADANVGFFATGANFPDALAAAALAGQLQAPLFITLAECVPDSIHSAASALTLSTRVIMGGTSAVSDAVVANTRCSDVQPAPPPPPPPPPGNPGNTKNCGDFATWREAQDWFEKYYALYGDVARLDGDNDLIACETLPGAP